MKAEKHILNAFTLIDSSFGIQVFRHLNYELRFLTMSMAPKKKIKNCTHWLSG